MTLYVTPCRCPACRARPRVRVTGLVLQMLEVCRPPSAAVVLTVACKCGGAILEVRVRDLLTIARDA